MKFFLPNFVGIANNPKSLWAKILIKKYLSSSFVGRKKNGSIIWATCKKGGPIFMQGLKWTIYNGRSINLERLLSSFGAY